MATSAATSKEPETSDMGVAVSQGKTTLCARSFRHLSPWHIGCIFALFGMSCVLPEPLDAIDDTKVNYPPVIVATDPPSTQPATIPTSTGRDFALTISDQNVDDILYVRYFVDYSMTGTPAGPIVEDSIPAGTKPLRSAHTDNLICDASRVPPTGTHYVTAVVADRAFLPSNQQPFFRAVPADAFTIEVSWTVTCTSQ